MSHTKSLKLILSFLLGIFIITSTYASSKVIEEEIVFQNGSLRFYGTIFKLSSSGKLPTIIIAHGSGKEHRKLRGMRSIAQEFAKAGYLTLLFDKRGVGDSDGKYIETPDYFIAAGDLIAAVNFVKNRNDVDQKKIGLYGHSQAGWIMPLAAVACQDISFMIVSCGGGVIPLQQTIYSHYTVEQKKRGHSDQQINELSHYITKLETYLATKQDYGEMVSLYEKSKDKSWFDLLKNRFETQKPPAPENLTHPGWLFFKKMMYDPELTLTSLKIPVLVVLSQNDEQVPSYQSKEIWEAAFKKSGQTNLLDIVWLSDQTHALFERRDGKPQMRRAFSEPIFKWLKSLN